MAETRKIAAILVADVFGYSRLTGADEEGTLARLRALRSDLIDPTIAARHGRVVKRTGDGLLVEFRSVVDAVRCAIEVQTGMVERNAGVPEDRRIEFRIGVHLGDVVEEADGDLMGDGVNIAARLEGVCASPARSAFPRTPIGRSRAGSISRSAISARPNSRTSPSRSGFIRSKSACPPRAKPAPVPAPEKSTPPRLSIVVLPFANIGGDPEQEHFVDGVTESLTTDLSRIRGAVVIARNTAFTYKGKRARLKTDRARVERPLCPRGQRSARRKPHARQRAAHRRRNGQSSLGRAVRQAAGRSLRHAGRDRRASGGRAQRPARRRRGATRRTGTEPRTRWISIFKVWLGSTRVRTPDNVAQARSFFERALTADPDNVDALIGSARADAIEGAIFFVTDPMAAFVAAEAKLTKGLVARSRTMRAAIMLLGLVDIFTKRAARASPNANMRWRWIEISPTPIPSSDLARFLSVAPKKQRLTLPRPCGSVRAIRCAYVWMNIRGRSEGPPRQLGRKRSRGFDGRSRPTEIIRLPYFRVGPPPSRSSVDWTRRVPPSRPASHSTRPTPSPAPAPTGRR